MGRSTWPSTALSVMRNRALVVRVLITFGILAGFRALAHVPTPGIQREIDGMLLDQTLGWLSLMGASTGGMVALVSLGIGPLIMASIAVQVAAKVIPAMREISRSPGGSKRIAGITRQFAMVIAAMQAASIVFSLKQVGVVSGYANSALAMFGLMVGAVIVIWMSERITRNGLGGGTTLLIAWGTLGPLGATIETWLGEPMRVAIGALALALLVWCVTQLTRSELRLPILVASLRTRLPSGERSYLPLTALAGGVMPVIFAGALATAPLSIAAWFGPAADLVPYIRPYTIGGTLLAGALTAFFALAYLPMSIDPWRIGDSLANSGRFIPGITPGAPTTKLIADRAGRMGLIGAGCLSALVMAPYFAERFIPGVPDLPSGTDLVILVGAVVAMVGRVRAEAIVGAHREAAPRQPAR